MSGKRFAHPLLVKKEPKFSLASSLKTAQPCRMQTIRQAEPTDAPACTAIARAAYAPYVPLIGREPPPMLQEFPQDIAAGRCWVIGDPAEAYVVAYRRGNAWLLENVAVTPEAQGKGHGKRLIAHIEEMARADGAEAVELYTNAKMEANLAMYPALGFVKTEERTEKGMNRVYFRKEIRTGV